MRPSGPIGRDSENDRGQQALTCSLQVRTAVSCSRKGATLEAQIFHVSAESTATGAYLRFVIELKYPERVEAPLALNGVLYAPHDTVVCQMLPFPDDTGINVGLRGLEGSSLPPRDVQTRHLWLTAKLGRLELEHLAKLRAKDPKGDVHFTVKVEVRYLESGAAIVHLDKGIPQKGFAAPMPLAAHQAETCRPRPPHRVLADNGPGFVSVKTYRTSLQPRIASSDWTHEFAPKFGLGKFAVFELPQPEVMGTGSVQERVRLAIDAARSAEDELRAGRWPAACEALRKVWEVIRNDSDLEKLLVKSGYSTAAAASFNEAVAKLFDFSSKFMHITDKSGNPVPPQVKAEKEDAYLLFSTAMSLLNLIAQKAR